jgi:hypothetical protein
MREGECVRVPLLNLEKCLKNGHFGQKKKQKQNQSLQKIAFCHVSSPGVDPYQHYA